MEDGEQLFEADRLVEDAEGVELQGLGEDEVVDPRVEVSVPDDHDGGGATVDPLDDAEELEPGGKPLGAGGLVGVGVEVHVEDGDVDRGRLDQFDRLVWVGDAEGVDALGLEQFGELVGPVGAAVGQQDVEPAVGAGLAGGVALGGGGSALASSGVGVGGAVGIAASPGVGSWSGPIGSALAESAAEGDGAAEASEAFVASGGSCVWMANGCNHRA